MTESIIIIKHCTPSLSAYASQGNRNPPSGEKEGHVQAKLVGLLGSRIDDR